MNVRFGIWNVTSFYRAGLLKTVATELSECKMYWWGIPTQSTWKI